MRTPAHPDRRPAPAGATRRNFLKAGGLLAAGTAGAPLVSSCSAAAGDAAPTLNVATVTNSQMVDMQSLTHHFTEKTGIKVRFLFLPENALRQRVTQDVAMQAGNFDVVTIGSYDAPFWGKYQWVTSLEPFFEKMSSSERSDYDRDDLLGPIRSILSYQDQQYAVFFYGESSMLYYRKDLFEKAGLQMPEQPSWSEITEFAKELNKPDQGTSGIILRGLPGWGANMAPFDTFINTYGGRWYDMDWQPQLTTEDVKNAITSYTTLGSQYGQSGITSHNFPECENIFASGDGAMWYDATSAAGYLSDPETSKVSDAVDFAYGPTAKVENGAHWLWSWSLGIESSSRKKDAAFEFIKWASSREYIQLVGKELGWGRVPPGTRRSSYDETPYGDKPWADLELTSIEGTDPEEPTEEPVPYTGVQYISIPEFQGLGNKVGRMLAAVLAGDLDTDGMADQAQAAALTVAEQGEYLKKQ